MLLVHVDYHLHDVNLRQTTRTVEYKFNMFNHSQF